jgi:rhomboid protease GluP
MKIIVIIIALNIAAFFLPFIIDFGNSETGSFSRFVQYGFKDNEAILQDGEYYRLITSNFLHANFIHLGVNMFSLWQVGPFVVKIFRQYNFLLIYFLSGIGGVLLSLMFTDSPSVGASTSLFGLIGSLLIWSVAEKQKQLMNNILLILLLNLFIGFTLPQIDNWGHLGGLISGIFLAGMLIVLGQNKKSRDMGQDFYD